jgi:hypothetical protein
MSLMLPIGDLEPGECKTAEFWTSMDPDPDVAKDLPRPPPPTPTPTTELSLENHDSVSGSFVLEFSTATDAAAVAAAYEDADTTRIELRAAIAKAIGETLGCDPSEVSIPGWSKDAGGVFVDYVITVPPGEGGDLAEKIETVETDFTAQGALAEKLTEEISAVFGLESVTVVDVDFTGAEMEEIDSFPSPSPTPPPTVSEYYDASCKLDTVIGGINLDPLDLCEVGENGWATFDHDSFGSHFKLSIEQKGKHEDAFRDWHGETVGKLEKVEKDARYVLACPQTDGQKTVQFKITRPANLTEFGGEWVQLFPKDSWENVTNEYEPFTFNDFGAKIPLLTLRPTGAPSADELDELEGSEYATGFDYASWSFFQDDEEAPLADELVVYMEVDKEGDYEVKYGNPRLKFNDKWIANEFKSTLLRVGTPWADCSGTALDEEEVEIGAIIPATYGHPNLNLAKYKALIAELKDTEVPVSVILEVFNEEIKSTCPVDAPTATKSDPFVFSCWTSSTNFPDVYTRCYEAGNACPENHRVCKAKYCETDTWKQIVKDLHDASPGKVKVLGQVDAATTPAEYDQLDMDGFYFVDPSNTKTSMYYDSDYSVIAVSEPVFDKSIVDGNDLNTVFVTLLDDAESIGVWTPFSWYPTVKPSKWSAMVSSVPLSTDVNNPITGEVEDLVDILADRGYGHIFLTTEEDFTEPSPVGFVSSLLASIKAKKGTGERRLAERELSVKESKPFWGCDDTKFECKPSCYKRTGLVTTKLAFRFCTDAPMDPCSCTCYHETQWICQGGEVVCEARKGAEEPKVVGDLVCVSRGTPKPELMELRERQAQQCEPLPTLRANAPTQQCLARWEQKAVETKTEPEAVLMFDAFSAALFSLAAVAIFA